jgi:putative oxidoreductase
LAPCTLPSGFGKLTGINGPGVRGFATYLVAHGVPGPAIAWSGVAAVVEFFASLAIVLGLKTRYAAALLILFTIGAALIGHPYWTIPDAAQKAQQKIHFFKDVAIIGGLLFVFVRGAGPISIDRR